MTTVRCSIPTAHLEKPFFFFDKHQQNTIRQLKTHKTLQNLSPANRLSVGVFKDGEKCAHPTGNAWYTWRGMGSGVVFTIKQILRKCTSSATRTPATRKRQSQGTGDSIQIIKKGFRYSNKLIKVTVLHIIPQCKKIGTKDSPPHEQTDKLTSCNVLGCTS